MKPPPRALAGVDLKPERGCFNDGQITATKKKNSSKTVKKKKKTRSKKCSDEKEERRVLLEGKKNKKNYTLEGFITLNRLYYYEYLWSTRA